MPFIFMDESGDLGFRKQAMKSSRYFVITFLIVQEPKKIEKIIKKTNASLHTQGIRSGIIHAVSEKGVTIRKILKSLVNKSECAVATIYFDKTKGRIKNTDPHTLYAKLTSELLETIIQRFGITEKIVLVASRRETARSLNERFVTIVKEAVLKDFPQCLLEIQIKTPAQEKCLQLADVVSWAILRKYEKQDVHYYELVKPLIKIETPFSQKQ